MTDQTILRLLEETHKPLSRMEHFESCAYLVPGYNALLRSARKNHPEEEYLQVLPEIQVRTNKDGEEEIEVGPRQLSILYSQLRIVLEGTSESLAAPPPAARWEPQPAPQPFAGKAEV
jgi:hypothetical protein